jgi:membrane-bound serine protease (ClpP class)
VAAIFCPEPDTEQPVNAGELSVMTIQDVWFRRRLLLVISLLPVLLLLAGQFGRAQDTPSQHLQSHDPEVWLLPIVGGIGPATADFVVSNLEKAQAGGLPLVLIRLDTPGGLDKSMRVIIRAILDSEVPVVCWVGPSGARAASAGTYILYACDIAAMAPGTNLGAATPVQIGVPGAPKPSPGPSSKPIPLPAPLSPPSSPAEPSYEASDKQDQNTGPRKPGSAKENKAINDAAAYIRSLAQMRGRNAEWAAESVINAASLSATEALEKGVIDLIANNPDDLLQAINGRVLRFKNRDRTLNTADLTIKSIEPDWRNRFLSIITDPNVAYILLLIGIYGLIFEFYSPGAIVPGVIGGICLLIALYALQIMPVNYIGFSLLLLGIALMVVEVMVPSFGMLGIGGIVAFVFGSILLLDSDTPGYHVAWPIVLAITVVTGGFIFLVIGMAWRIRKKSVVTGIGALVGRTVVAQEDFDTEGIVKFDGELWTAESQSPVKRGDMLKVKAVSGLKLEVTTPTNGEDEQS